MTDVRSFPPLATHEASAISSSEQGWPWTDEVPAWPAAMPDGTSWPLLSVVTPSFNQGQYLEATMRSVLLQGYPNLEYLVIDGGSTDHSVETIRRYAPHLSYWVSEPDGGQGDAINKGWQRVRGDIIAYLNSDDGYTPDTFQRVVAYFHQHPDVDLVHGTVALMNAEGAPIERPRPAGDDSWSGLLRAPLNQPTIFMRRRVLDRLGFFDRSLYYVFDWEFCLRAILSGVRIGRMPGAPLAVFRVWAHQKTENAFERQVEEQWRMRDRLLADRTLPPHLINDIRFSKAWICLWPAYKYYTAGQGKKAREVLHRAITVDRRIVVHPAFVGLYARTLLSSRFSAGLRRMKTRLTS